MPKKIIWSTLSEKDFSGIMSYLNKKWDAKVSKRFIDIIEEILEQNFIKIQNKFTTD